MEKFLPKKNILLNLCPCKIQKAIETISDRNFTSPSTQLFSVRNGDFV